MYKYEEWKKWSDKKFASASKEESLYFSKLKKKFKLGDNLDVLEIGFGNGAFLDFSKNLGWNITGVELIPNLIKKAQEHDFQVFQNIDEIPIQYKYDLIVAFDVIEHIDPNQIFNFLKKIKSLLNYNGAFVFRVPNGSSPFGLGNQHGDVTHLSVITESKVDYWAKCMNLEISYSGSDIYLFNNGKIIKIPIRVLKRILQLLIERILRWIFSPQSKGFLASNSMYLLIHKNNES